MKRIHFLCATLAVGCVALTRAHWPKPAEPELTVTPPHSTPEERPGLIAEFEADLAVLDASRPPFAWFDPPKWIRRLPRPFAWWAMRATQPAQVARIKRERDYEATVAGLESWLRLRLGDEEYCTNLVARRNAGIDLRIGKQASMLSTIAAQEHPDWDQETCNQWAMERAKQWAEMAKKRPLVPSPY